MASKNSGSDNPWAEMSRLNLDSKAAKAPAPDSPRAAAVSAQAATAQAVAKAAAVTATAPADDADAEVEYTEDELQDLSLKELRALADEAGIDAKGLSKDELISALLDSGSDEDELAADDSEEELDTEDADGEMSLEEALALLGEDSDTEDFAAGELEEVEEVVLDGDVTSGMSDNPR